jgi:dTMP kinase
VFGFVNMSTRVVLMLAIALSSVLVGLGSDRTVGMAGESFTFSTTRILLLVAGAVGVLAGVAAFRQMDDKRGVPILADLWGSLRGRPLGIPEAVTGRGAFIVFEGGEGAGKSTQVELLAVTLRSAGHDVVVTREPGATPLGARIRTLLLDPAHPTAVPPGTSSASARAAWASAPGTGLSGTLAPRAEALLYAADRAHHVATVVRPALEHGSIVISDRYVDSSLAYQGAGRTLPTDEVSWLSAWATGGLRPDLVVVLDIDPVVGAKRVAERGVADRLEAENAGFHDRVRYSFLDIAGRDPRRYLVVDGGQDPERIAAIVGERVRALVGGPDAINGAPVTALDEQPAGPPPAGANDAGNGRRSSSDTNGSGTNGSGTNGSGTNGSGTNGSGTNGSGTNGSSPGESGPNGPGGFGGGSAMADPAAFINPEPANGEGAGSVVRGRSSGAPIQVDRVGTVG